MSIAVNLVARNEEKRLYILLPMLKEFVDEIVVVDQSSTDRTVEVANEYAKVIVDKAHGYAEPSRPLAMENTESDWIIMLDCDEFITNRFRDDIPKLMADAEPNLDGFILHLAIVRQDEYDFDKLLQFGWNNSLPHKSYPNIYRMFRKNRAVFGKKLHEPTHIPHKGLTRSLWYNAIVEVKNPAEDKIDRERYAAIQKDQYDPSVHF